MRIKILSKAGKNKNLFNYAYFISGKQISATFQAPIRKILLLQSKEVK